MNGNGTLLNEWKLREQMCEIGRRVYNKGFAAANDGNISLRLDENRVLCTPTRVSKGYMKPDDLCIVDLDGKQLAGKKKRSSEILLHLTIMKARADVRSVVHCHPPHATAFAVAREPIPKCVLPEIEVFLGEVAISPYETPGSQSFADTVLPYVKDTETILLANHGTVTYGSDLEDAYFKTEIIDAYCRILLLARQLGRVHYYSDQKAAELIRLKPGLGIPDPRLERGLENCDLCGNSLFREGYGASPPEPHVFVHPKLADGQSEPWEIESRWTPLAAELKQASVLSPASPAPAAPAAGAPSSNGRALHGGAEQEALVQAITNQVMQVLNGAVK
jgi:L-fuculose-phosphate aldolase